MSAQPPVSRPPEAISKGYLQWRCRRGMKELDVMLVRFLENDFTSLSQQQIKALDRLLDEPDTRIWQWLLGRSEPDDVTYRMLISAIKAHR